MTKKFSEIIIQIIKDFNLTQAEFAEKISVGQSTVSRYIAGIQIPSYDVLQKICISFGIDGNEILGLDK